MEKIELNIELKLNWTEFDVHKMAIIHLDR